jgi:hypothetical protein
MTDREALATADPTGAHRTRLAVPFAVWLTGNSLSMLGDVVMYFALGWAASAHGGRWAAVVLSGILVPRVLLTMFGGVLGDRLGARLVMLVSDGLMIVVASGFAVCAIIFGTPVWLLLVVAVLIGTVDACYLPSSGSMPRRLLQPAQLARGVAAQQIARQVIGFVGAPLGGLIVAVAGTSAAAGFDAGTFAVMLIVMCLVRPRHIRAPPDSRRNAFREAADGLLFAGRDPVLRTLLLLVASVAGFLIPVTSLLIPLLGRENHWSPAQVGLITGAQAAGMAVAAGYVISRAALPRPGIAAAAGLLLAGLALAGLALAGLALDGLALDGLASTSAGPIGHSAGSIGNSSIQLAVFCEFVVGLGTGLFATHLGPLILAGADHGNLSRVQAVLLIAQSLPLLLTNNLLGWIATAVGAAPVLGLCAAVTVLSAGAALCVPALRAVRNRAELS